MQTKDISALEDILNHLPLNIREALEEYAIASEMPIEFVIEMATLVLSPLDRRG